MAWVGNVMATRDTQPRSDNVRFLSSRSGTHILDTYLEAAEIGGKTIGDILAGLTDANGNPRSDAVDVSNNRKQLINQSSFTLPAGAVVSVDNDGFVLVNDTARPHPYQVGLLLADTAAGSTGFVALSGLVSVSTLAQNFVAGSFAYINPNDNAGRLSDTPTSDPWPYGLFIASDGAFDYFLLWGNTEQQFTTTTGSHGLAVYVAQAEIGGRTLGDILADLTDASGFPKTIDTTTLSIGPVSQFPSIKAAKDYRDTLPSPPALLRLQFEAGTFIAYSADADSAEAYWDSAASTLLVEGASETTTILTGSGVNKPAAMFKSDRSLLHIQDVTIDDGTMAAANIQAGELMLERTTIRNMPTGLLAKAGGQIGVVNSTLNAGSGGVGVDAAISDVFLFDTVIDGWTTGVKLHDRSRLRACTISTIKNCALGIYADELSTANTADLTMTDNTVDTDPVLNKLGQNALALVFDSNVSQATPSVDFIIGASGDFDTLDDFAKWMTDEGFYAGRVYITFTNGVHVWSWDNKHEAQIGLLLGPSMTLVIEGSSSSSVTIANTGVPGTLVDANGGTVVFKSVTIQAPATNVTLADGASGRVSILDSTIRDFKRTAIDAYGGVLIIADSLIETDRGGTAPNPPVFTSPAAVVGAGGTRVTLSGADIQGAGVNLFNAMLDVAVASTISGAVVGLYATDLAKAYTANLALSGNITDMSPLPHRYGNQRALILPGEGQRVIDDPRLTFSIPGDFDTLDELFGWLYTNNVDNADILVSFSAATHQITFDNRKSAEIWWSSKDNHCRLTLVGKGESSTTLVLAANTPLILFDMISEPIEIRSMTIDCSANPGEDRPHLIRTESGQITLTDTTVQEASRVASVVGTAYVDVRNLTAASTKKGASRNAPPTGSDAVAFHLRRGAQLNLSASSISGFQAGVYLADNAHGHVDSSAIDDNHTGLFAYQRAEIFVAADVTFQNNTRDESPTFNATNRNRGGLVYDGAYLNIIE